MSETYLQEVRLPSKGVFYGDSIPDGIVQLEPMGTREEKLFAGGRAGTSLLAKIFSSCVKLPDGFDSKNLVLGDSLFLLLKLRSISYGAEYTFPFRCEDCRKKSTKTISLDNLLVFEPASGSTGTYIVELPLLGKILELRQLTVRDEEKIESYARQMEKHGSSDEAEVVYRLARRVEKIDDEEAGIRESMELIDSLKGLDSLALTEAIQENDVGPDLEVEAECSHCAYLNGPMNLPLDRYFFRPSRRRSKHRDAVTTAVVLDNVGR